MAEYNYRAFTHVHELGKAHPLGKEADDLRKDAKNVNFLAQFGGQALKLADMLGMRPVDAQVFLDARSAMFPDVERAAKRAEEACYKTGYAVTYMGARRHLREAILSDNRALSSRAARQAWNMEIQGSAGEMTKLAMSRLWTTGALFRYDVRFFASIYDELVVSVHKDHCADFMREMQWCMTRPYSTMQVPILGSISIGPDFGNQIECGTEFSLEKINAALKKIFHKPEVTA
jgi:DNA polymerase-1